ncbi:MAG: AarF/ABC1/UbiB kinase family protein [Gammaproteobacteria bacterium]|nr:AarF/ABC1/UbiB kinase family protein [Gammaproteobacteria bacterium]
MGKLAGSIAGNMVSEGARQLAQGQKPRLSDLLLTPANAQKLSDRLSEMRGAAMKVGQLLSMDSGHILPPQLTSLLARLREDAHQMPLGEVAAVLEKSLGANWDTHFRRFTFKPLAAASIGQVHEAVLRNGRRVAVKIQYPGIRQSIDSDVDNVASLLQLSRAIPDDYLFSPLLEEAKRQLHAEADYRQEAAAIDKYSRLLSGDTRFETPQVIEPLSSSEVLTMSFLDGQPIECLAEASKPERDGATTALLDLAVREMFEWGLVQTDPNFSNYLYQPDTGCVQLLDFGATRAYSMDKQEAIADLFDALLDGCDEDVRRCAVAVGYMEVSDPSSYQTRIIELLRTATEPVRALVDYDFAKSDLAKRMSKIVLELRLQEKFTRIPPPEILFLHRKLGGLHLLLSRLRARLPVRQIVMPYLTAKRNAVPASAVCLAV